MASIHKRTLKDGSVRYYVMWRDPAHKQRKFGNWRRKSEAAAYKSKSNKACTREPTWTPKLERSRWTNSPRHGSRARPEP